MNFKNYLLSQGKSTLTADGYVRNLSYYLNWCEDQNLDPDNARYNDVLGFIKSIQQRGIEQSTVRTYVDGVKHYFSWLQSREIREDNPVQHIKVMGIKRKQLYHILTMQELEQLYEKYHSIESDTSTQNQNWYKQSLLALKRSKVILGLMIWQGMKTEEIQKLTIHDIKLREGKINIPSGRKYNGRELKLQAPQIMDLMEYIMQVRTEILNISKEQTDLLFISTKKGTISNSFHYLITKLKELNPSIKSAQQIRACVITHWLKNYNLRQVQQMAGHRYVSSTESYFINDLDGLQEDIEKFHPIG